MASACPASPSQASTPQLAPRSGIYRRVHNKPPLPPTQYKLESLSLRFQLLPHGPGPRGTGQHLAPHPSPLTRTTLLREPMPWTLHAGPAALSSTSPSGRTNFRPRNSGSSYSTQLWHRDPGSLGWRGCTHKAAPLGSSGGFYQVGWAPLAVLAAPGSQHSALTSLGPLLWRPRGPSWRHQQCLPKPPCCCLGSRALRRGPPGQNAEGGPQALI